MNDMGFMRLSTIKEGDLDDMPRRKRRALRGLPRSVKARGAFTLIDCSVVEHGALRKWRCHRRVAPRAAAQGVWSTVVRRMFRPHLRGRGRRSAPSYTTSVSKNHFIHVNCHFVHC